MSFAYLLNRQTVRQRRRAKEDVEIWNNKGFCIKNVVILGDVTRKQAPIPHDVFDFDTQNVCFIWLLDELLLSFMCLYVCRCSVLVAFPLNFNQPAK